MQAVPETKVPAAQVNEVAVHELAPAEEVEPAAQFTHRVPADEYLPIEQLGQVDEPAIELLPAALAHLRKGAVQ